MTDSITTYERGGFIAVDSKTNIISDIIISNDWGRKIITINSIIIINDSIVTYGRGRIIIAFYSTLT